MDVFKVSMKNMLILDTCNMVKSVKSFFQWTHYCSLSHSSYSEDHHLVSHLTVAFSISPLERCHQLENHIFLKILYRLLLQVTPKITVSERGKSSLYFSHLTSMHIVSFISLVQSAIFRKDL